MSMSETLRKALLTTSPSGVVSVAYSAGQAMKRRGWVVEEIGDRTGDRGRGFPVMTLRLNEDGMAAVREVREQEVYRATFDSVTSELDEILKDRPLGEAIAEALVLVERVERSGQSSVGARAYLDALQAHAATVTT